MIWTSTFKFCPTLFIGIKSLLIKNVFQHEKTLGKWLHFVPSGYILFRHPTGTFANWSSNLHSHFFNLFESI